MGGWLCLVATAIYTICIKKTIAINMLRLSIVIRPITHCDE